MGKRRRKERKKEKEDEEPKNAWGGTHPGTQVYMEYPSQQNVKWKGKKKGSPWTPRGTQYCQ